MADLDPEAPLDIDTSRWPGERWSFAEAKVTDVLAAFILTGNCIPGHSFAGHIDWVEIETAYPVETRVALPADAEPGREAKLLYSGVNLGAVAVNGQRVPFSMFIPDGIRDVNGFEPFSASQVAHIREVAFRRKPKVTYKEPEIKFRPRGLSR